MAKAAGERRLLGVVEVDSGTLLISDPAHCLHRRDRDKPGIDYEAVLALDSTAASTYLENGVSLLISKFGGDGAFPVYGDFDEGELIRVVVEFIGPLGGVELA